MSHSARATQLLSVFMFYLYVIFKHGFIFKQVNKGWHWFLKSIKELENYTARLPSVIFSPNTCPSFCPNTFWKRELNAPWGTLAKLLRIKMYWKSIFLEVPKFCCWNHLGSLQNTDTFLLSQIFWFKLFEMWLGCWNFFKCFPGGPNVQQSLGTTAMFPVWTEARVLKQKCLDVVYSFLEFYSVSIHLPLTTSIVFENWSLS